MGTVRQSPVQKNAERSKGIFAFLSTFLHFLPFISLLPSLLLYNGIIPHCIILKLL